MTKIVADAEQAKQTCLIEGCSASVAARGWCNKHYKRWRAHGDPVATVTRPRDVTLPEAFAWHQTSPRPESGCWDWSGRTDDDGYGEFNYGDGRPIRAHRASYLIHVGEIPDGLLVRHTCDRPICVQPGHLILGTNDDNMQDMVDRGRAVRGTAHHNAKLDDDSVRAIRRLHAAGATKKGLARQFEVSDFTINQITSGRTWRHVR